jgi:hypothetical protein
VLLLALLLQLAAGVVEANGGGGRWWSAFTSPWSPAPIPSAPSPPPRRPSEPTAVHVVPYTAPDPNQEALTEESRETLSWLLDPSKVPAGPYSGCWLRAVGVLQKQCKEMDHGTRQFLALYLTNCQLAMGGRRTLACPAAEKATGAALAAAMGACLKKLATDDAAFTAFNSMWIVTNQVCNELSRTLWEQQAQATISQLGLRAVEAVGLLHDTKAASATILQRQQEGLVLQREAAVLQGEVREGLTAAREETGKLAAWLEEGLGELLEQQRQMQETQEQTSTVARQLLQDMERAHAMHEETHEAVERWVLGSGWGGCRGGTGVGRWGGMGGI